MLCYALCFIVQVMPQMTDVGCDCPLYLVSTTLIRQLLSSHVEYTTSIIRPIATDAPVAWCIRQSVCHAAALCKNDRTD